MRSWATEELKYAALPDKRLNIFIFLVKRKINTSLKKDFFDRQNR